MTPTATQQQKAVTEMLVRTVALALTFSGIGNRKKVASSRVAIREAEKQPDVQWISASKKLIDASELQAISKLDGQARKYIESRALPSMLKRGVYLMPTTFVVEANNKLEEFATKRRDLVEALILVYAKLVEAAKERLGDVFSDKDYVNPEFIRAKFQLRWQYITFNTPVSLKQIGEEVYEQEKAKAESMWAEARETIQQVMRANMAEMVSHLVEKLTPGEDGKAKTFKSSSVAKFKDFLATFDERNITNDEDLKALVDKANGLIAGVDSKTLRSDDNMRQFVRDSFSQIKTALDPMIVKKPTRAISFDEE